MPKQVYVEDRKERTIAYFYLGKYRPVEILTSPGITGDDWNIQNRYVVKALNGLVENVKQAAKDGNHAEFEQYLGLLQQFGPKRRLEGVEGLVECLRDFKAKKHISLLEFYQHAID